MKGLRVDYIETSPLIGQPNKNGDKSSTMEVLLERSQSHFVAQLWLPPLLELHSKEVTGFSELISGRNP